MWTITLPDLQFRRRQFAIAVVGAGLAFALALVLTGMSAGFRHEAQETVGAIGAESWVVPRGVTGPFTSDSTMPAAVTRRISGVEQAEPLVEFGHVARTPDGEEVNVNVIGHAIGQIGDPVWGRGEASVPRGEAVVDERLGVEEGDSVTIGVRALRVARVVSDRTYFAGMPTVFVSQRRLMLGLSAQAVVASLLAAALVAQALGPSFPLPVVIEPGAYVALPLLAIVIGVIASLAAMRRAMRVDPALAFSGV